MNGIKKPTKSYLIPIREQLCIKIQWSCRWRW